MHIDDAPYSVWVGKVQMFSSIQHTPGTFLRPYTYNQLHKHYWNHHGVISRKVIGTPWIAYFLSPYIFSAKLQQKGRKYRVFPLDTRGSFPETLPLIEQDVNERKSGRLDQEINPRTPSTQETTISVINGFYVNQTRRTLRSLPFPITIDLTIDDNTPVFFIYIFFISPSLVRRKHAGHYCNTIATEEKRATRHLPMQIFDWSVAIGRITTRAY